MKVKSESEVTQSCPTPSNPMDCSLPGSSVHGIFLSKSTGVGCHCLLRRQSVGEGKLEEGSQKFKLPVINTSNVMNNVMAIFNTVE